MMLLLAYRVKPRGRDMVAFGRMGPGMHRLEFGHRDVGIAGRHGQRGMPQDGLDIADVGAAIEEQRRHRVPEDVAAAGLTEAAPGKVATDLFGELGGGEGPAPRGEEKQVRLGPTHECGPGLGAVAFDPVQGALADRDDAILAPLALPDEGDAAHGLHVLQRESSTFGASQARGVERFHEGPVPEP